MLLWELGKYPGMQTEMMSENAGTWDTSHPAQQHLRSCGKCSCLNCQCQSLRVGHKYFAEKSPRPSPCECWDLYFLEIFTISWQLPLFLIRSIWTVVRKNPFEGGSVELLPNAYGIKQLHKCLSTYTRDKGPIYIIAHIPFSIISDRTVAQLAQLFMFALRLEQANFCARGKTRDWEKNL